jgi:hypothetical protein
MSPLRSAATRMRRYHRPRRNTLNPAGFREYADVAQICSASMASEENALQGKMVLADSTSIVRRVIRKETQVLLSGANHAQSAART